MSGLTWQKQDAVDNLQGDLNSFGAWLHAYHNFMFIGVIALVGLVGLAIGAGRPGRGCRSFGGQTEGDRLQRAHASRQSREAVQSDLPLQLRSVFLGQAAEWGELTRIEGQAGAERRPQSEAGRQ
jgi:hypothetical protein